MNTHPEQWAAICCGARGAVGGSVPCSRAPCSRAPQSLDIHSPHLQFLLARDSKPFDYKSDSLTIMPFKLNLQQHVFTVVALAVTWAGCRAGLLQDDLFVPIHSLLQVSTQFLIYHTARILPRAIRHKAGHVPEAQSLPTLCTLRKQVVLTLMTTIGKINK